MSLRIMIVDDDPVARRVLKRVVETLVEGEIVEAANGMVALDLVVRTRPDLVFLDMQMPGLGGHEVLQTLRVWPLTRQLPVIMLTATSEEVMVRRCVALGVSAYLVKPIDPRVVAARLARLLPSLGPAQPPSPSATLG